METTRKIYCASQLIAALPPTALKVLMWMLGWQSQPTVTIYVHQYSRTLKLSEEEVEIAIQTLIDKNLIFVSNIDNKWRVEFNKEQFEKYYQVKMQSIIDSDGIKLSEKVTWNIQDEPQSKDAWDMSEDEIKKKIQQLQIMLTEKEQTKRTVKQMVPSYNDDLPF